MDDLFQRLETQIRTLIERCEDLERENQDLQQNISLLLQEKETLSTKNTMAISQIENMISRLKSIESTS